MTKFTKCIFLFLLISSSSYSQYVMYDWFSGKCTYSGEYDTSRYSPKKIEDTKIFCYDMPLSSFFYATIEAWTPEKIANPDTVKLKKDYESYVKYIKGLNLINSPFWEKQRQHKLAVLKENYQLIGLCIKGYKHPEKLREFSVTDSSCNMYIAVLAKGGDNMLAAWKSFREQQCMKEKNPKTCLDDTYYKKLNSKQKYDWARIDLMMHVWYVCAIQHAKQKDSLDLLDKEFKKMFRNVNYGCED